MFSCGVCCTCARIVGENLSECVRSLVPKTRSAVSPASSVGSQRTRGRPSLPVPSVFMRLLLHESAHGWRRLDCSLAPKNLTGRLFLFLRSHPPCVSAHSGRVVDQVSDIHMFSCGVCCTCARMAGEDLSACVRSLAPKNLPGDYFFSF